MTKKRVRFEICGKEISFETGEIARQSGGAILARCGETVVFSSICQSRSPQEGACFCPLRVDYQEKFSSIGKTVGGFIKREGRPSEKEVLVSRLIDRSLRPTFLKGFSYEVQSLSIVWSYDRSNLPDTLAICASSAALAVSSTPVQTQVGAVRVALTGDHRWIVNPSASELSHTLFDCTFSGTPYGLTMVEGHGKPVSESLLLEAAEVAMKSIQTICNAIEELREIGKEKIPFSCEIDTEIESQIRSEWGEKIHQTLRLSDKIIRQDALHQLRHDLSSSFSEDKQPSCSHSFDKILRDELKTSLLKDSCRLDGRKPEEIRPIQARLGHLPCVHGSAIFTRGETQSVAVCTLGSEQMSQRFETLDGEGSQRFYLHYFFPSFCVGEVGKIGSPGRRELGHGKLAERALTAVLPEKSVFPYVIRIESTITESSGSSSMASVCGGCLALIDAGVPIQEPVAGIAMGLLLSPETGEAEAILSDISELEDMLGDMDFKLAGTSKGFTALQMDVKVRGIPISVLQRAISQAGKGVSSILGKMVEKCPQTRRELPDHVPRIETVKIPINKIAVLIGSNGRTIRSICEQSQADLNIEDGTGIVYISAPSKESIIKAKKMIEALTIDVEVGKIYHGKVKSVAAFGLFIEVMPGKEGLCHVSEMISTGSSSLQSYRVGDKVDVKVLEINAKGQIRLTQRTQSR
ncbi:polyribonucleotide nucleotidyltransferase [Candidatus Similichlamydia epinepheli]|uniref:polyribonucleotide nucleotidyltransferase n=1 Tax=Candidatus Similichlamydia epinepheli TaxID=1903953 RepID=UPI000D3A9301|nr:polyribonucleotide nucleotidyltransferase [Candidatus Similichlamydia epinepheli]